MTTMRLETGENVAFIPSNYGGGFTIGGFVVVLAIALAGYLMSRKRK